MKVEKKKKGKVPLLKEEQGSKLERLKSLRDKINGSREFPIVLYEEDSNDVPVYPTRFIALNSVLGGGARGGAIIEFFGLEESGKSSCAICFAADIQKSAVPGEDHVVLVNFEGKQPWSWWKKLGLNVDRDHFTQLRPKTLEEGVGHATELVKTGAVRCVIYDSVFAASAKDNEQMLANWRDPNASTGGGGGISVEARQWGKAWIATRGVYQDHNTVCIAVNQVRDKIELGSFMPKYGKQYTTPRGHALKFFSWVRFMFEGKALLTPDGKKMRTDVDGKRVKVKVMKNQESDDDRKYCEYDLIRGVGFDLEAELIDYALAAGFIIGKGGGFFTMPNGETIRGRDSIPVYLEENPELKLEMKAKVEKYLQTALKSEIVLAMEPAEEEEGG